MSKSHGTVLECPLCGSHHVAEHCETKACNWWVCRKCGTYGVPGGNHYKATRKAAP